ncbi:DUF4334 domain-containing protein [Ignatzschineria rhizosphaerae]|uniref:DUF4334 domain-containing protein n=1 Tax=Ignatzschineria rhizosphaerae TaxID=2923279 RepID=A0ABY3X037_9GAMM|nr:DUF4334 domain-containing protein [Ignatzschineria rhizosphaerae]UNM96224.1 DUF4334 domain-containing protein [Ignatzschineria rhizosphaerae]
MMKTITQILTDRQATTEEALAAFDQLAAVPLDFLLGRWRGFEIDTNHPTGGNLENSGWYGKVFKDFENVYPLVYYTEDKKGLFAGDPLLIVGKTSAQSSHEEIQKILTKARSKTSHARIRMLEHRGVSSATMIYDNFPINDIFRKIDDNRILGVMDFKGSDEPYFFVLERDDQAFVIDF